MEYFSVIGGLILLIIAGDKLVEGAVAIAERLNVSKLVIGITVVSFGTSAPELVVGVDAALAGVSDMALGNVVGSNIANVLLVLGIPALLYPFSCDDKEIIHSMYFMLLATVLLILLSFFGPLSLWQGIVMILILFGFLYYSIKRSRRNIITMVHDLDYTERALGDIDAGLEREIPLTKAIFITILGLAGLIFGAHILVDGATTIARGIGVSEVIIGLTVIAIGTSLPELVTSVMAARNKHGDVAIGNVIGSNLFNILAIMGVTSVIAPVNIPDHFMMVDYPILLATSLLLIPFVLGKVKISRLAGLFFLMTYILYMIFLAYQANLFV